MVKEQSKSQNAVDLYDPTGENGIAERPQALRYPENKNNLSLAYAQSAAERISNRSYCTHTKPGSPQTARFCTIPLILP